MNRICSITKTLLGGWQEECNLRTLLHSNHHKYAKLEINTQRKAKVASFPGTSHISTI